MKKLVSALLTLVMLFSLSVPAFAAESAEKPVYNGEPVIVVRGIDFMGLTYDDGTLAMEFKAPDIIKTVLSYLLSRLSGNKDALIDNVVGYLQSVFGPIASDKNGNSVYPNVGMKKYPLSVENYPEELEEWTGGEVGLVRSLMETLGEKKAYLFTYDWRKSPMDLADDLNSYIENVKAQTGSEKVDLIPCSMGGMVTAAYLYEYGGKSVDTITFNCAAHNGTYVVGYALSGDITIDGDILSKCVASLSDNALLQVVFKFIEKTGIYDFLSDFLNDFIAENKERVYDELLRDYLGTSLGYWGMCPDEYFDSAADYVFGGREEYKAITEELREIKVFACSTEKILSDAEKDGVKLNFALNYDGTPIPIYEKANLQTDGVIEADLGSNGATFALVGETLSDEYLKSADRKYISPDKIIDASTAAYRDNTWFVKNVGHVGCSYGGAHSEFIMWLATSERETTAFSDERYPMFMAFDKNQNRI